MRPNSKTIFFWVICGVLAFGCAAAEGVKDGATAQSACADSPAPTSPIANKDTDTPAQPTGGMRALGQNIEYPQSARRDRVSGTVLVQFVVDESGCIRDVQVREGVEERLDRAAIRAILRTQYNPAILDGEQVAVFITEKIAFRIR